MKLRWYAILLAGMMATGAAAQQKPAAAAATETAAPEETKELNTQAYIQLLRTDLQAKREAILQEGLQLDEKQAAAFWPVYRQYAAEQQKLGDQKLALIEQYANDFATMTDAKADGLAQKVMALDQQRLALREKYYAEMKKVLPTVLVVRFFQLENQIQLLVDLQIAAHLPIIEEAPAKQ